MSDTAIRVDNLSKLYHIGMLQQRHDTLRDALTARFRGNPKSNPKSKIQNPKSDDLWALRDVSFEIKRGEVVGIIGRNGAGKSTLLKILSRITEPTSGRAEIHGRVGSLLEVGTGFHPELTGRENIYLNGAILGMRRSEIDRRFDEIVAFAEIERFLDTPVKRYSSGMYVRLAFAVAAHLEPEILLVDEVLAVGDAAFQKKCLGKMGDVAKHGRTVLFVSHNMGAVQALCARSIMFHQGQVSLQGPSAQIIQRYLHVDVPRKEVYFHNGIARDGTGTAYYTSARLLDDKGKPTNSVSTGGSVSLELTFETRNAISHPMFGARLHTPLNQDIVAWRTQETLGTMPSTAEGGWLRLHIENLNLLPGLYYFAIGLSDGYQTLDLIEDAIALEVVSPSVAPSDSYFGFKRGEFMHTPSSWEFKYL